MWARTFLRAWVCRPWRRPNESKCHASRCKCQWHPGWSWLCLFVRFRRSSVGPKIEGNFQEMILVVHFLIFKQETHKWHHVCASRVSSLFCEIKDRLQGKQNTSNLFSSRVGMTLMSLITARRAVHAAMEVISEVLDLVSPLNSSSPR